MNKSSIAAVGDIYFQNIHWLNLLLQTSSEDEKIKKSLKSLRLLKAKR